MSQYYVLTTGISENFLTRHLRSIKENNTIISASADGKVGFISADDIADLAVSALADEKSHNTDHIITDPELLTYDDVRPILSFYIPPELIVEAGSCDLHRGSWPKHYTHAHHCRAVETEIYLFWSSRRFRWDALVFGWPER